MNLRLVDGAGREVLTLPPADELIPVFLSRDERDTLDTLMHRLAEVGAHDSSSFLASLVQRWEVNFLMRDTLGIR